MELKVEDDGICSTGGPHESVSSDFVDSVERAEVRRWLQVTMAMKNG